MSNRDVEFDAITPSEIFTECRDRLQIGVTAEAPNRQEALADLEFCEGEQWDTAPLPSGSMEEPQLTINLTDAMVRRVVNNMKQQRPRGKCHPVGDGADINTAKVINGIGRHVEYRSSASVAYDLGGEMAVKVGFGYWRLVSEYVSPESFDQDLRILPIDNVFTVYMDPAATLPTGADADWAIITGKMKRTEYRRSHPRADNAAWNGGGPGDELEWEDREEIRLAEYLRIREIQAKLYLLRDKSGMEFVRPHSRLPAPESLAQAGLEIIDDRMGSTRRVEWFRLNGTQVVDRRILPGTFLPLFRCAGNSVNINGKIRRRGMVRAMRDPQRMVNFGEVAKIKRLGLAPKAPWVAAEGQLDGHPEWNDANTASYSVLTYKPVTVMTAQGEAVLPPPQRQQPAGIEAGFAEFVQGMRANLLAVAGMPNEPGADMQGQVISGKAIQRRQVLSDQSHFQYYDNQTLAIAQTWRVMLEWAREIYPTERMQRIIGEDGMPSMVKINEKVEENGVTRVKNDITVGEYDVVMDTGPGYETKREEGAEALMALVGTQTLGPKIAQVGADLVVRSLDHPYMQELADRLAAMTPDGLKKLMEQLPEQARPVVQALTAENEQLKKALEQMQLEHKFGMAKEQLKAATATHDTVTRADTAISVAEIRAGAQLLNSPAESGKHPVEAEHVIKEAAAAGSINGSAS
jgi:hypothetical protein